MTNSEVVEAKPKCALGQRASGRAQYQANLRRLRSPPGASKEGAAMSDWTTDKPSIGTYWLSIAVEKRPSASGREDFPAVIKCHVHMFPASGLFATSQPGLYVQYDRSGDWLRLDQDWFKGAQWKRVDAPPSDPFIKEYDKARNASWKPIPEPINAHELTDTKPEERL